ncbi:hypothetical protein ABFS82_05G070400 [Erythranthe guttata]|uniref:Uncharacterized protein n=1 Tax=Erythranthe guttata TaxID=4155 RepID=A0A022QXV0_ERYGU|nr:PREDICTED: uncharacterized protein LOC105962413 [Erythranthe guttata]EYU33432.1 hypothetical protein MIMGU_mgv1a016766mg [Erythranthe guttata]|eukprot:XP_012842173.1 PREDICTED: uncharacterized protein LOC105962413 [Erythranthe guttata]
MSSGSLSSAGVAAPSSSTMDDDHHLHHELALAAAAAADVNGISILDSKDQALLALKSDLMAKLNKEVKSLDDDSWMFDGPRSCIHQILGPGGLRHRRAEISTRRDIQK